MLESARRKFWETATLPGMIRSLDDSLIAYHATSGNSATAAKALKDIVTAPYASLSAVGDIFTTTIKAIPDDQQALLMCLDTLESATDIPVRLRASKLGQAIAQDWAEESPAEVGLALRTYIVGQGLTVPSRSQPFARIAHNCALSCEERGELVDAIMITRDLMIPGYDDPSLSQENLFQDLLRQIKALPPEQRIGMAESTIRHAPDWNDFEDWSATTTQPRNDLADFASTMAWLSTPDTATQYEQRRILSKVICDALREHAASGNPAIQEGGQTRLNWQKCMFLLGDGNAETIAPEYRDEIREIALSELEKTDPRLSGGTDGRTRAALELARQKNFTGDFAARAFDQAWEEVFPKLGSSNDAERMLALITACAEYGDQTIKTATLENLTRLQKTKAYGLEEPEKSLRQVEICTTIAGHTPLGSSIGKHIIDSGIHNAETALRLGAVDEAITAAPRLLASTKQIDIPYIDPQKPLYGNSPRITFHTSSENPMSRRLRTRFGHTLSEQVIGLLARPEEERKDAFSPTRLDNLRRALDGKPLIDLVQYDYLPLAVSFSKPEDRIDALTKLRHYVMKQRSPATADMDSRYLDLLVQSANDAFAQKDHRVALKGYEAALRVPSQKSPAIEWDFVDNYLDAVHHRLEDDNAALDATRSLLKLADHADALEKSVLPKYVANKPGIEDAFWRILAITARDSLLNTHADENASILAEMMKDLPQSFEKTADRLREAVDYKLSASNSIEDILACEKAFRPERNATPTPLQTEVAAKIQDILYPAPKSAKMSGQDFLQRWKMG